MKQLICLYDWIVVSLKCRKIVHAVDLFEVSLDWISGLTYGKNALFHVALSFGMLSLVKPISDCLC